MREPRSSSLTDAPLRILAVSALWQGANDYAFVRAFRRAGYSVRAVSEKEFMPPWQGGLLRLTRRLLRNRIVEDYNKTLLNEARMLKPDLLFVFKGALVKAETLRAIRGMGVICIQYYPDTGFEAHSPLLRDAIQEYNWFFSTKPCHSQELKVSHNFKRASFLPHAFDPETHVPVTCSARDLEQYRCDVSFIGNISPKKRAAISEVTNQLKDCDLAVWGSAKWGYGSDKVAKSYRGSPVFGLEYAKAISLSKINLGLLFEGNDGASPDVLTARTFEIPGAGGFMMHERTVEAEDVFLDGKECVFFDDTRDLIDKIRYYLAHEAERATIAEAGRRRSIQSGYSTDERAQAIIEKYHELRAQYSRIGVQQ